jgi:transposase
MKLLHTFERRSAMLYNYFIEKSLGAQDIKLKEYEFDGKIFSIEVELPRKEHKCPVCGEQTDRIHDYRKQRIKAGEINGYFLELLYRKRRYRCERCSKNFYENNDFVGRY